MTVWHAAFVLKIAAGDGSHNKNPVKEVRKTTCSLILKEWYDDYCCVICSCFPASLSLCVKQGASHSFSPTRNTHTQLTGQKPAVGRRGICALMDRQRSHLENRGCVLSSCLANTQLYMADTIEQREGLERKATETGFCVCTRVIYCGSSKCKSCVGVLFLQKVPTHLHHVLRYDRWSSCGFLVCLLYTDLLACLCWFMLPLTCIKSHYTD